MGCFVQIDDSGRHWLLRRLSHTAHRMLKQETVLSRPEFVFENEWDVLKRGGYECLSKTVGSDELFKVYQILVSFF